MASDAVLGNLAVYNFPADRYGLANVVLCVGGVYARGRRTLRKSERRQARHTQRHDKRPDSRHIPVPWFGLRQKAGRLQEIGRYLHTASRPDQHLSPDMATRQLPIWLGSRARPKPAAGHPYVERWVVVQFGA